MNSNKRWACMDVRDGMGGNCKLESGGEKYAHEEVDQG